MAYTRGRSRMYAALPSLSLPIVRSIRPAFWTGPERMDIPRAGWVGLDLALEAGPDCWVFGHTLRTGPECMDSPVVLTQLL